MVSAGPDEVPGGKGGGPLLRDLGTDLGLAIGLHGPEQEAGDQECRRRNRDAPAHRLRELSPRGAEEAFSGVSLPSLVDRQRRLANQPSDIILERIRFHRRLLGATIPAAPRARGAASTRPP